MASAAYAAYASIPRAQRAVRARTALRIILKMPSLSVFEPIQRPTENGTAGDRAAQTPEAAGVDA